MLPADHVIDDATPGGALVRGAGQPHLTEAVGEARHGLAGDGRRCVERPGTTGIRGEGPDRRTEQLEQTLGKVQGDLHGHAGEVAVEVLVRLVEQGGRGEQPPGQRVDT